MNRRVRCDWCGDDPIYVKYHDREWGRPVRDDRSLFEFLLLESAQAGLSWITILRKRDAYRKAYHHFDPERIARYSRRDVERLMSNAGIVRNRAKIEASIDNARAYLAVRDEFGSGRAYLWSFVGSKPLVNRFRRLKDLPAFSPEAERMSKDLKARGFRFVGPTICYAFMQATGMVNDHLIGCYRHPDQRRPNRR
ncbi:MAG: DNA-3-methyladenine glycosylase I [Bacteroidetes bacterium]|jgi:DNA-3-methyladenine glycosylase I|nr:DNA-3-methyladenine glycosylase I [Bacteroidota bacterium]